MRLRVSGSFTYEPGTELSACHDALGGVRAAAVANGDTVPEPSRKEGRREFRVSDVQ